MKELSLDTLAEYACHCLPEDWELRVTFTRCCLSVELFDPDGGSHEDFDETVERTIIGQVNRARESDGLSPEYPSGWDEDVMTDREIDECNVEADAADRFILSVLEQAQRDTRDVARQERAGERPVNDE